MNDGLTELLGGQALGFRWFRLSLSANACIHLPAMLENELIQFELGDDHPQPRVLFLQALQF